MVGVRGIPSIGTLRTAVITNSRAEAKAFSMELSFLRNKLVTIPRTALFKININTRGLFSEERDEAENALMRSPWEIFQINQRYIMSSSSPYLGSQQKSIAKYGVEIHKYILDHYMNIGTVTLDQILIVDSGHNRTQNLDQDEDTAHPKLDQIFL